MRIENQKYPSSDGFFTDLRMTLFSVLALAYVAFLGQASHVSLRGIDSNIHARVSLNVTAKGIAPDLPIPNRYVTNEHSQNNKTRAPDRQKFSGPEAEYFNDHPFTLFWLNGWIMRLLEPTSFSARLLTASFSVGSVYLVYLLGALLYSSTFGILAALFLIFTRDFLLTSGTMSLDTALVFFILLSFNFWLRKKWLWLGLTVGIGLWMKTPMVLLVYPTSTLVCLMYRLCFRKSSPLGEYSREHLNFRWLASLGLALFVGSWIWIYSGLVGGWPMVLDYWQRQVWGTSVLARGEVPTQDVFFFFRTIRTGFLPGLPFLIYALIKVVFKKQAVRPWFVVPLVAVLIVSTFVTLMTFKLGHYFTPVFPFMALLSAYSMADFLEKFKSKFLKGVQLLCTALFLVLVVSPIELAPEAFVALTKFETFISTHGNCDDTVVLVPGGEPVGSSHDYGLHLSFYTGRRVQVIECSKVNLNLQSAFPHWMILSDENFRSCLSEENRKKFGTPYRMGTQVLLSRYLATSDVDLTPLLLERKAVKDCESPEYPQDLWHQYLKSVPRSSLLFGSSVALAAHEVNKNAYSDLEMPLDLNPQSQLLHILELNKKINEYSVRLSQRERIGEKLSPLSRLQIKYSAGKTYVKVLAGPKEGGEILYSPATGRVTVHRGKFPDLTVTVDPTNHLVLEGFHHRVDWSSYSEIASLILEQITACSNLPGAKVQRLPDRTTDDGVSQVFSYSSPWNETPKKILNGEDLWSFSKRVKMDPYVILHTNGIEEFGDFPNQGTLQVPKCYGTKTTIGMDAKTHLITFLEIYDKNGRLYESYRWEGMDLSPLTDLDFDPKNPNYRF